MNDQDDKFELYDLRVEIICPPGKRILCGAKAGDYFTLKGEMLELPPNQGISIYSLCEPFIFIFSALLAQTVRPDFRIFHDSLYVLTQQQHPCSRCSPQSKESLPKMTGCLPTP